MCSLMYTSFTAMTKTSCKHWAALQKTTGMWSWLSVRIIFSILILGFSSLAQYLRSRYFNRLAIISFRASWGKASTRAEEETEGEKAEGAAAFPHLRPQGLPFYLASASPGS